MESIVTARSLADASTLKLRRQVALARTLLDGFDAFVPPPEPVACAQLTSELTRLGCRILEIAAELAATDERARLVDVDTLGKPPSSGNRRRCLLDPERS